MPKNKNPKHIYDKKRGNKFPHFRLYSKSNHPALIVGEKNSEEYNFRKVTSSEKEGRHNNEMVYPNPDKNRTDPMYINKRVRSDKKSAFSKWIYPWRYKK